MYRKYYAVPFCACWCRRRYRWCWPNLQINVDYGGIMALEIRNIPVLTGSTAESFVRAAEEHEKNPRRLGLKVSFAQIDEMAARARSYREAHNGKNPFSIWLHPLPHRQEYRPVLVLLRRWGSRRFLSERCMTASNRQWFPSLRGTAWNARCPMQSIRVRILRSWLDDWELTASSNAAACTWGVRSLITWFPGLSTRITKLVVALWLSMPTTGPKR